MTASGKREGVRGLPRLPTAIKVIFELYCNLDVWSPYCLYTQTVLNRQYLLNLKQKLRWVKGWLGQLEGGLDELEMVEQQHVEPLVGDRDVYVGDGDSGNPSPKITSDEVEEGRVEAAQDEETPVAAYETEGQQ